MFVNSGDEGNKCTHFLFACNQDMSVAVASPKEPESEEKPQKSLNEKQQVSVILATRA